MRETFIHPTAEVQTPNIGRGTIVWQHCIILKEAVLGQHCNINLNVFIENKVRIGDNVTIKPGVQIYDGITIEDDVFIGPNVTFTNDLVPRSGVHLDQVVPTVIRKGASLGANSTIIAGVIVGEYSLVGAGSVVTKDVPPYTVWYGNPARQHGYITRNGVLTSEPCPEALEQD